jgi:hypothetical protein
MVATTIACMYSLSQTVARNIWCLSFARFCELDQQVHFGYSYDAETWYCAPLVMAVHLNSKSNLSSNI